MRYSGDRIEPFLIGARGEIVTQEDAVRVIRGNSHYFFGAGVVLMVVYTIVSLSSFSFHGNLGIEVLAYGFMYVLASAVLVKYKSRMAAISLLIITGVSFFLSVVDGALDARLFLMGVLFAAAIRSVKASFIYHRLLR